MVTFTKAAVAELHDRVRLFIRGAYKVSQGKEIKDTNITRLVLQAIENSPGDQVQQLLRDAVLLLDETSVLTIHSFCQQTLNEFAFETSQLFGAEMLPDIQPVIEDEFNKFWRKNVTTLDKDLLQLLWNEGMRNSIRSVLKEHLGGKKYERFDETQNYEMTNEVQLLWKKELEEVKEKETKTEQALYEYITLHSEELRITCQGNRYAKKGLPELLITPGDFVGEIKKRRNSAYILTLFPEVLKQIDLWQETTEGYRQKVQSIHQQLYCLAIKEVSAGLEIYKKRNNILGYDDLIGNLHHALAERDNPGLIKALQHKYRAVFVDEFQDTDRLQFEIFDRAFRNSTILFYIGDPKQSIYAWRKADIFTYFKARNGVDHLYNMNYNYRSAANYIEAMNRFFHPSVNFDTFYFNTEDSDSGEKSASDKWEISAEITEKDRIDYIDVESPVNNTHGFLCKGTVPDSPFSVFYLSNKEAICQAVAAQTACLLQEGFYHIVKEKPEDRDNIPADTIQKEKGADNKQPEKKGLRPADIGILVRSNREGKEIKSALAGLGIPAVTVADSRVLLTEEAKNLRYLLEAMETPDRSSINRALLSPFTGFTVSDILQLDDEIVLVLFGRYHNRWLEDGVYTALMDFITDFQVREVLLRRHTENGERILTNLFQLTELVHEVQNRKNLSMTELIAWLQRGIEGMATEGDAYIQRMESDEEAVKIVTIHKSKGLEYNIVLVPFLDFVDNTGNDFVSFRDPVSGDYLSMERERLTNSQLKWYQQQQEQENRRLLYVAVTRAVYKCYVYKNEAGKFNFSTLATFLTAVKNTAQEMDFDEQPEQSERAEQSDHQARHSGLPLSSGADQPKNPDRGAGIHPPFICFESSVPAIPEGGFTTGDIAENVLTPTSEVPVYFHLKEENWRKMSYSMLAARQERTQRLASGQLKDEYDDFIFHVLPRGDKTGNLLHSIFEKVHFSEEANWDKTLEEAVNNFAPVRRELYLPKLRQLLNHVLHTPLTGENGFSLAEVSWNKRISELEFDFPVQLFRPEKIIEFSGEGRFLNVRRFMDYNTMELEGIMNGKIDLFFEYEGLYYVLDWKSNYLGNQPSDYSPQSLVTAMDEGNYHLQYLIYTLAVKKYLQTRISHFDYEKQFGGVIYLFVRGMRNGSPNGIFTVKPPLSLILQLEDLLCEETVKNL
jgi:exodeoxyribonuclease V beta subunit